MNAAYEYLSDKLMRNIKGVTEQTSTVDECSKITEDLSSENELKRKISCLEKTTDNLQQFSRANYVEVREVP